ncbi:hypothetical protein D3C80_1901620 [compost metagenome]
MFGHKRAPLKVRKSGEWGLRRFGEAAVNPPLIRNREIVLITLRVINWLNRQRFVL